MIAFAGKVPARESGFIGEILQPAFQELDTAVIGLRNDLLAAQEICHDKTHFAGAIDRRDIRY